MTTNVRYVAPKRKIRRAFWHAKGYGKDDHKLGDNDIMRMFVEQPEKSRDFLEKIFSGLKLQKKKRQQQQN